MMLYRHPSHPASVGRSTPIPLGILPREGERNIDEVSCYSTEWKSPVLHRVTFFVFETLHIRFKLIVNRRQDLMQFPSVLHGSKGSVSLI